MESNQFPRKSSPVEDIVDDLLMISEEDPLSMAQARAYRKELQFTKTFALLLSEDGVNPKDFGINFMS